VRSSRKAAPRAAAQPAVTAPPPTSVADYAIAASVAAFALVLYVLTAARDIVVGDTADFVAAALTLGVAHAPGYPLLTMIGHALSWLPLGPAPFRVNLIAALSDAAAIGVICLTMTRLTPNRVAVAVAGVLVATVPLYWRWSLEAEAFPLNNLFASMVIYMLVRWEEVPARTAWLVAGAFAAGLALSNHMTIMLVGPAILLVVWRQRAAVFARPQVVGLCLAAVLAGLVPYVYIPWAASRHPYLNTGGVTSLASFIALVTRADYGSSQLVAEAANAGGSFGSRVAALLSSFTIPEGLLIVTGAAAAWRTERAYLWFAALAFLVAGPAFMAYANLDVSQPYGLWVLQRFFLLSHVILAPFVALGVALAIEIVGTRLAAGARVAKIAIAAAVVAAAGASVATHYRALDQSNNHLARTYAEDVLSSLDPHAILLGAGDDVVFTVTYLQAVEHVRMDVTPIWTSAFRGPAWYRAWLRARDPDLVLAPEGGDPQGRSVKAIAEANRSRPIAFIGPALDDSVNGSYAGVTRGLVAKLEPASEPVYLDVFVRDNEQLMSHYRVPAAASIKAGTFETGILRRYAIPALVVGNQLERARDIAAAKQWYERAIAIDPNFADARDALGRVKSSASLHLEPLERELERLDERGVVVRDERREALDDRPRALEYPGEHNLGVIFVEQLHRHGAHRFLVAVPNVVPPGVPVERAVLRALEHEIRVLGLGRDLVRVVFLIVPVAVLDDLDARLGEDDFDHARLQPVRIGFAEVDEEVGGGVRTIAEHGHGGPRWEHRIIAEAAGRRHIIDASPYQGGWRWL
jgi:Protein of unknown function (DUF2723)